MLAPDKRACAARPYKTWGLSVDVGAQCLRPLTFSAFILCGRAEPRPAKRDGRHAHTIYQIRHARLRGGEELNGFVIPGATDINRYIILVAPKLHFIYYHTLKPTIETKGIQND